MEKNLIAQFEVSIPKAAKALAKFVGKDKFRPAMQYVCIEPSEGFAAATEGFILQIINLPGIAGEYPDGMEVLVNPKHIAQVAGKHVTISVHEEAREVEGTRVVSSGAFCGSRTITEKVTRTFQIVEIECDGETLTTETKAMGKFPAVKQVIPKPDGRKIIRLTAESLKALKTICKLHKDSNYIVMDTAEGSDFVTVGDEVVDYTIDRAIYTLKLAAPAEFTAGVGFPPRLLSTCLNGADGVISFSADEPQSDAVSFDGEADVTLLMPCYYDALEYSTEILGQVCPTPEPFADNAAAVLAELQEHAAELWWAITKDGKCSLTPGNYSAKDIANRDEAKWVYYIIPDKLTINHGNISLTVDRGNLFGVLAAWEAAVKCKKSVFPVGNAGETTASEAPDGSIRTKVLQYKSDGNTVTEKWEELKKFAEGIYYAEGTESHSNIPTYRIVFEDNGVFWYAMITGRAQQLELPENRAKIIEMRNNFVQGVQASADAGQYIRLLEITVMHQLGYDTAPLYASREAYLKRREEEEREKAEAAKRREQEREEAEKHRKAELLSEGKEKLLNHEAITVEQIELIAEAVGYTIHARTLGFMREKVSEVILKEDGIVTVWGRKLTQRNINGTADVIRELAERVKAQAEAEAQEAATATETPQIPAEAAETVKCATEGETAQETAYMEPYNIKYFVDKFGDVGTLDRAYEEAIRYTGTELVGYESDRRKGGKYRKRRMSDLVKKIDSLRQEHEDIRRAMILYFRNNTPQPATITPQPAETPPKFNHTARPPRSRHRQRERQNIASRKLQTVPHFSHLTMPNTPRRYSTANSPPHRANLSPLNNSP